MSTATPPTYPPGQTVRIWASDLTHLDNGPITSDATVTFELVDLAGNVLPGGGTGVNINDDWYLDFATPATPGPYRVLATATVDGDTWKGAYRFNVGAH